MSQKVNIWIALRDDAQAAIQERLEADENGDEYNGPVGDTEARIFKHMTDRGTVQRLFRQATIGGRTWTLWNLLFSEPRDVLQKIRRALDHLEANYPNQFAVAGAWWWDGSQVRDAQGDPIYPIHGQLAAFMPDGVTLEDVNLYFGQSPRDFS